MLELRMLEATLAIDAEEQGRGTLGGLLSLVSGMASLPARKTVVLFSEGLSLPTDVDPLFQSLIAAANRANVSFYTLDAVGLRTRSGNEEMRRELLALRPPDWTAEDGGGGSLRALERNEGLLRIAPGSGLGRLASETGGLLTQDTNALMAGLKQVDEDLAGYYLLTYVPTNTNYDGRFRSIDLRVRVPHGTIQGRKGYLAIRSKSPTPVLTYEAPAIAALERGQSTPTIRVRARGLDVPMAYGWSRVAVIVEVQGQDLHAELDQKKQLYLRDFTIVALVRDAYGRLIRKMGQHYLVSGPIDKFEEANKSSILFYREAELPAGAFALSVAAWDANQALAGSVRTEIRAAPAAGGSGDIRLGSIVVVRQAEPVPSGDATADHVLRYGDVLLYPNLGEPVRIVPTGQLAFLATAHSSGPLSAQMALFAGGVEKWHQGFSFPPPESDGVRRFVGTLPLGGIARGEYELRLTIPGSSLEPRRASLTLVDP